MKTAPLAGEMSFYDYNNLAGYDYTETTTDFPPTTTYGQQTEDYEVTDISENLSDSEEYPYYEYGSLGAGSLELEPFGARELATSRTNFRGCKDMELAYSMDTNIKINCDGEWCNLTCKKSQEIPQISKDSVIMWKIINKTKYSGSILNATLKFLQNVVFRGYKRHKNS